MPLIFADGFNDYRNPPNATSLTASLPLSLGDRSTWSLPVTITNPPSTTFVGFAADSTKGYGFRAELPTLLSNSNLVKPIPTPDASNDVVVGWRMQTRGQITSSTVRVFALIGTSGAGNTTPTGVVARVSIRLVNGQTIWAFEYNGTYHNFPAYLYRDSVDIYFEVKLTTTGVTFRINGSTVYTENTAPSETVTTLSLRGNDNGSPGVWYDDVYVSYGNNEPFLGPQDIMLLPGKQEVLNVGFTASQGSEIDALDIGAETYDTIYLSSSTGNGEYTFRANVEGYHTLMITHGSRTIEPYPVRVSILQGEVANALVEVANVPLQTEYVRWNYLLDANAIIDVANPEENGIEFRYFGFKIETAEE